MKSLKTTIGLNSINPQMSTDLGRVQIFKILPAHHRSELWIFWPGNWYWSWEFQNNCDRKTGLLTFAHVRMKIPKHAQQGEHWTLESYIVKPSLERLPWNSGYFTTYVNVVKCLLLQPDYSVDIWTLENQKLNWTQAMCDIISEDSHTLPPERGCHCTAQGQSRA